MQHLEIRLTGKIVHLTSEYRAPNQTRKPIEHSIITKNLLEPPSRSTLFLIAQNNAFRQKFENYFFWKVSMKLFYKNASGNQNK